MGKAGAAQRKEQARSATTRTAMLDAALEELCARGYAAMTTSDVAARAGLSRGAQLHHFPTKARLLAATVEHLLALRLREFEAALRATAQHPADLDRALDLLWAMFQGPAFVAWVELWIAARTDPALAEAIIRVDHEFTRHSRLLAAQHFSSSPTGDGAAAEMMRDFAFALMTGVALQRLVPAGQRPASDYLAILKLVARQLVNGGPRP